MVPSFLEGTVSDFPTGRSVTPARLRRLGNQGNKSKMLTLGNRCAETSLNRKLRFYHDLRYFARANVVLGQHALFYAQSES